MAKNYALFIILSQQFMFLNVLAIYWECDDLIRATELVFIKKQSTTWNWPHKYVHVQLQDWSTVLSPQQTKLTNVFSVGYIWAK